MLPVDAVQANLVGSPSQSAFIDPNLWSGTWHYVVQAVDAWGRVGCCA